MPNPAWTSAMKEAFALCPSNVVQLNTLSISHPILPSGTLYLVQDRQDWNLTLEDGTTVKTFVSCAFSFKLPPSGEGGIQALDLSIDNIGNAVSDFLDAVADASATAAVRTPITVIYRPYLSNDPTKCQMTPPLTLWLTDAKQNSKNEIVGKANFMDVINKPFLTELYTRSRFPSLGNEY
jgi:hypothetical protein